MCLTRVEPTVGFRLRRGEEFHHDWLIARPILQTQPAILQKLHAIAIYQPTHTQITSCVVLKTKTNVQI